MFTFQQWLAGFLVKAAGHKYIKRIPYQSGGRLRYRYIYNVTHTHAGKHVLDPDHMRVGTKLMLDATAGKEVHGHITAVSGDKVTFAYDDGPRKGESVTMSKAELAAELDKVHGISDKLSTARAKQKAVVDKLKERGASEKQIAREQRRLEALGAEPEKVAPKKAEPNKRAEPKKRKRTTNAEDALRFYETEGAEELYKTIYDSLPASPADAEYAHAVSQIKSAKKGVIIGFPQKGEDTIYRQETLVTYPDFSSDDLVLCMRGGELMGVPQRGPFKGYRLSISTYLSPAEAKVLLYEMSKSPDFMEKSPAADVTSEDSLRELHEAIKSASASFKESSNTYLSRYKSGRTDKSERATVTRLMEADIKGKGAPVVHATTSYESGEAIPAKVQRALKSLLSTSRPELSNLFYQEGHVYGGNGYTLGRVKVDRGQEGQVLIEGKMSASDTPPPSASHLFDTEVSRITTINEQEAKDLAHALKGILTLSTPVRLETSGGVTSVSFGGKRIGEFPSHEASAPSVSIGAQPLRDILLTGAPLTLGRSDSGLIHAESASMQLLCVPLKED